MSKQKLNSSDCLVHENILICYQNERGLIILLNKVFGVLGALALSSKDCLNRVGLFMISLIKIIHFNFLLFVVSIGIYAQPPIRIGYKFLQPENREYIKNLVELSAESNEIIFVNDGTEELMLVDSLNARFLKKKPIILVSWFDFASVPQVALKLLKDSRIHAYFGNFILREKSLNLKHRCGDTYHGKLINRIAQLYPNFKPSFLNIKGLNKILCVPWTFQRNLLGRRELKKINIDFDGKRSIDVNYSITLAHKSVRNPEMFHLYEFHRMQALAVIKCLHNISTYVATREFRIPYQVYIEKLKDSKVVVSPWGWGEWCWRDFEAILCGAVLIKPDTSFVKTHPDLYKDNEHYVVCKNDFSDLEEKIRYVLAHYDDYKPMRIKARQLLLDYTEEKFFNHFVDNIKKVYEESKIKK